MTRDDIIGTWNITDFSVVDSAGEITKPWGDDIAGLLIYTADGYVSGILGPANSDGKSRGSGYSGRYEIHGDEVHHHVLASENPDLIGSVQVRGVELNGDELLLTSATSLAFGPGYTGKIGWRRAGPA